MMPGTEYVFLCILLLFFSTNISLAYEFNTHSVQGILLLFFFFLFLFRATPVAHGVSQARGLIGATAAGHGHSHSNAGSKLRLPPIAQLTAMPDP